MDEWHRAIAFMRALDEGVAEQVVPFAHGRAFVNRRWNRVYDANYLSADHLAGATASALAQDAERIQGAAGLTFRRVNVDDQEAAVRLTEDFRALGFQPECFVIMVKNRPVDRVAEGAPADEVAWETIRAGRRLRREAEPWATPPLIDQQFEREELTAELVPTRYFAVVRDGLAVSSCELRTTESVAQVETVETIASYRKRGFARAVVTAALNACAGHDFVFLVADQDDWPQHFYARLGFDAVGIESRFLRVLDD